MVEVREMNGRRKWFVTVAMGLTAMAAGDWLVAANPAAPLREQLKNGLRATRPEELQFVEKVVTFVEAGQLSIRTVNAAFDWARKRRPDYPFPYFERALRVLAAREGVNL